MSVSSHPTEVASLAAIQSQLQAFKTEREQLFDRMKKLESDVTQLKTATGQVQTELKTLKETVDKKYGELERGVISADSARQDTDERFKLVGSHVDNLCQTLGTHNVGGSRVGAPTLAAQVCPMQQQSSDVSPLCMPLWSSSWTGMEISSLLIPWSPRPPTTHGR